MWLMTVAVLPALAQEPVRINPGETGKAKLVYRETKTRMVVAVEFLPP